MFRLAIVPPVDGIPATIKCVRRYTELPIREIRTRLADGIPIFEFAFHDIVREVRLCRSLLRDLDTIGAAVRVYERVEGWGEREESIQYLRNVMRRSIQIRKEVRDQMFREAEGHED